MVALAEAADVAAELGLEDEDALSDAQQARVPSLLVKASALFRREAGRQFTAGSYTHRLQVVGGRLRLSETPVTDVVSVVDDCGNTVAYTRSGDWLNVSGHHDTDASFSFYRPAGQSSGWWVTVTYTGGAVPDEVRVTVAQMVARALNVDPEVSTGVRSHEQSAGPFSESKTFFDWAGDAVSLTDDECTFAASFRYPATNRIVHRA